MNGKTTFNRGRRLAIGLNVLVASLAAPLVGGLLIYLAFRPEVRRRVDLTARQSFTLSERSQKVLTGLTEPIDVYTCFRPTPFNESGGFSPGLDEVIAAIAAHCNDLLREIELRSGGKVRLHSYDPNQTGHLARISELSRAIGEPAVNVAVVARGERRRVLRLDDLAAYDAGTQAAQQLTRASLRGFRDEEALAKAILSVTEERASRIAFLEGHGERGVRDRQDAAGLAGMSLFGRALIAQNYQLGGIDLSGGKPLGSADIEVLVIADPIRAISPAEVESIVRFAGSGGRVLLMLSPSATNALDFPLVDQLFGLTRAPSAICQEAQLGEIKTQPDAFFAGDYSPDHPIVQPLRTKQLRLHWQETCSFTPHGRADPKELAISQLLWSGKEAWLDLPDANGRGNRVFDPSSEQKQGPYVMAVAVERHVDGGRAVLLGSASALDDAHLDAAPGNRDFGLNVVDWLTSREQLISIAPRPFELNRVDLSPAEFRSIFLYVVAGIPALALLAGIAVFWARRN